MSTVKVLTSELTGAALDWAVAQAVGAPVIIYRGPGRSWIKLTDYSEDDEYAPSTKWSQGGPLIEENNVGLSLFGDEWLATPHETIESCGPGAFGATQLVAACRSIVLATRGPEVEVPQELVN